MFGAILKATNSSFQKGMIFGRSLYVKKVMKLLAFIFEQPSYWLKTSSATRHVRVIFYGDLVYKFKRIIEKPRLSDQFKN